MFLPDGQPVAAVVAGYCGAPEEGERVVRPLRAFGQPIADTIGPLPYTALQALLAPAYPYGRCNYWKSGFMDALPDAALAMLLERFATAPTPYTVIGLEPLGGAVARVGGDGDGLGTGPGIAASPRSSSATGTTRRWRNAASAGRGSAGRRWDRTSQTLPTSTTSAAARGRSGSRPSTG